MGIGKKFYIAAASLVVAVGALVALNATGSQAISSFRNCNDDAIIRCGAITEAELLQKYDDNVGDVQNIYKHYGITRADLAGTASVIKHGTVYQDGRVVVDGKTVATGAFSVSRVRYTSAGTPRNVVINGKTYYEGPSMAIFTGPVDAYVYMRDGVFHKAVLSSCGNPLIATPPAPKPVYKCDSLTANKIDRTRFEFTAAATAKNGAAIAHYVFDFGDGKTKTQNSNVVEHEYAAPGTYTVKVKVNISIDGERQYVTSKDCEVVIKVEKAPVFACEKLEFEKLSRNRFRFTSTASAANGAEIVRYSYDFGDGNTTSRVSTNIVEHTYAEPGDYTVTLSVDARINGEIQTKTGPNCKVTIEVEEETKEPVYECVSLEQTKISRNRFGFSSSARVENGAEIVNYTYDFGDGITQTGGDAIEHTYANAGTYTATVTVNFRVNGEIVSRTGNNCKVTIEVEKAPVYECVSLEQTKISRNRFTFTTTALAENGAEIVNYTYNFGDGNSVTGGSTVSHTYANPGIYTTIVMVNFNVNGEIVSKGGENCKVTIKVEKEPVYKCESLTSTKISRTKFSFETEATAENGAEIVNYTYNFGDGNTITSGSSVEHTYSQPGTYTATVTVNFNVNGDILSKTSEDCKVTIEVEKEPAYKCDNLELTKISRTRFKFTSSATAENGAQIVNYTYNFGDGTTQTGGSTIEHTYAAAGTYTATVTVNFQVNGENVSKTSEDCKVTVVVEEAPIFKCESLDLTKISRTEFRFATEATAENGAQIVNYTYNFGDGTTQTGGSTIEHTYAQPGTYTASVTVNFTVDGKAESATAPGCKVTVEVEEEQQPVYKCESLTAQKLSRDRYRFTATASATNAQIVGYTFTFGDGSNNVAITDRTVEHAYAQPGTYTAKVTAHFIANNQAQTDTNENCEVTVEVEEQPEEDTPSIEIVKTVNGKEHIKVGVGVEFTYDITVLNTGNIVLKDAVVTDKAPSQVTLISAAIGTIENNEWTHTIPELKVGESKSFTIKAKYPVYAGGMHKNTVCVDTPTVPGSPDDCDDATTETKEPIEVCDLTDNMVKTIEKSEFDESHMTTDLTKCGTIEVCIIKDKVVKVIAKNEYDASTMTTDMSKCEETPETPPELPKTGLDMFISGGLGISSITAAGYYFAASRRNLLNALLNR